MKQLEVIPNSTTFRALVAACLNAGDSARAEQAVHEMVAAGWEPDAETAESLLRAVASRQGEVSPPGKLLPLLHRFLPCVAPAARGPLLLRLAANLCEASERCGGDAARLDEAGRVVA